jgi:hypothetical protein
VRCHANLQKAKGEALAAWDAQIADIDAAEAALDALPKVHSQGELALDHVLEAKRQEVLGLFEDARAACGPRGADPKEGAQRLAEAMEECQRLRALHARATKLTANLSPKPAKKPPRVKDLASTAATEFTKALKSALAEAPLGDNEATLTQIAGALTLLEAKREATETQLKVAQQASQALGKRREDAKALFEVSPVFSGIKFAGLSTYRNALKTAVTTELTGLSANALEQYCSVVDSARADLEKAHAKAAEAAKVLSALRKKLDAKPYKEALDFESGQGTIPIPGMKEAESMRQDLAQRLMAQPRVGGSPSLEETMAALQNDCQRFESCVLRIETAHALLARSPIIPKKKPIPLYACLADHSDVPALTDLRHALTKAIFVANDGDFQTALHNLAKSTVYVAAHRGLFKNTRGRVKPFGKLKLVERNTLTGNMTKAGGDGKHYTNPTTGVRSTTRQATEYYARGAQSQNKCRFIKKGPVTYYTDDHYTVPSGGQNNVKAYHLVLFPPAQLPPVKFKK